MEQPLAVFGRGYEFEYVETEKDVTRSRNLRQRLFRLGHLDQHRLEGRTAGHRHLLLALRETRGGDVDADELTGASRKMNGIGPAARSPFDHPPPRASELDRPRAAVEHDEMPLPDLGPQITASEDTCITPMRVGLPAPGVVLGPVSLRVSRNPRARLSHADGRENP